MNTFGIIDAAILWFYGLLIAATTIKNWNHSNKTQRVKYSEIVYAIAYELNGFAMLYLFNQTTISNDTETILYLILLVLFVCVLGWLWSNVLYTSIRIRKHPEILNDNAIPTRNMEKFLKELNEKYDKNPRNDDIVKDLTRKALHFVLLAGVWGLYALPNLIQPTLTEWGLSAIAFRNFSYMAIGFFFIFMFTTADMVRIYKFHLLPDWAMAWYNKSMEPKTESYTYISSIPFVLTLLLFSFFPIQVLLCTCMVSCVGDAMASIIGKSFGKHKMTNFGRYPHKSFEGLIAGVFSSFIGVIIVFQIYPMDGVTNTIEIVLGLLAAVAFIYVDAFSKYIVDNVLNSVIPGVLIYAAILFVI
jgi:dolichol kinase